MQKAMTHRKTFFFVFSNFQRAHFNYKLQANETRNEKPSIDISNPFMTHTNEIEFFICEIDNDNKKICLIFCCLPSERFVCR